MKAQCLYFDCRIAACYLTHRHRVCEEEGLCFKLGESEWICYHPKAKLILHTCPDIRMLELEALSPGSQRGAQVPFITRASLFVELLNSNVLWRISRTSPALQRHLHLLIRACQD